MKRFFYLFLLLFSMVGRSQIIFTESMATVIDTTRILQGTIAPEFNFKTEKENFFQLKNNANISFLIDKKKAITFINQVEMIQSGSQTNVNNGYIHGEYRYLFHKRAEVYPFFESVWSPSRGLLLKLAGGLQSRFRILHTELLTWTTGVGAFWEYEKWNYNGVPEPHSFTGEKQQRSIKSQLYSGFHFRFAEKWRLTASAYLHNRLDSNIVNPRWAMALDLKHNVTEHFGVWLSYQYIYHTRPIVPVKKGYTVFTGGVFLSF